MLNKSKDIHIFIVAVTFSQLWTLYDVLEDWEISNTTYVISILLAAAVIFRFSKTIGMFPVYVIDGLIVFYKNPITLIGLIIVTLLLPLDSYYDGDGYWPAFLALIVADLLIVAIIIHVGRTKDFSFKVDGTNIIPEEHNERK